jgi:hypothetical protein
LYTIGFYFLAKLRIPQPIDLKHVADNLPKRRRLARAVLFFISSLSTLERSPEHKLECNHEPELFTPTEQEYQSESSE